MQQLLVLAVIGLLAQLVDGSLGMGQGVISTSLLLTAGMAPATASASVHLAKIGTTVASGAAHWRFGNVDWRVVGRIAVPGIIGAVLGATALSWISTATATPWMAIVLLVLGAYILVRFTTHGIPQPSGDGPPRRGLLAPLGLVAGFVDATGGGGWGPVATPALLASGRMEARKVIGSVATSEFAVACAASIGFLYALGSRGVAWLAVGVLLASGVVIAPPAAWLVRKIPPRLLGSAVGGVIILTNIRTLLQQFHVTPGWQVLTYVILGGLWFTALGVSLRAVARDRATASAQPETAELV